MSSHFREEYFCGCLMVNEGLTVDRNCVKESLKYCFKRNFLSFYNLRYHPYSIIKKFFQNNDIFIQTNFHNS